MVRERNSSSPRGGGSTLREQRRGGVKTPRPARSRSHPTPDLRSDPPPPGEGSRSDLGKRNDLVLVGEFGRAHGLKGEVRLKSHTGDPQAIADYRPLIASNGRTYSLKSVRAAPGDAPDLLIAVVDGVTTREAAEA